MFQYFLAYEILFYKHNIYYYNFTGYCKGRFKKLNYKINFNLHMSVTPSKLEVNTPMKEINTQIIFGKHLYSYCTVNRK